MTKEFIANIDGVTSVENWLSIAEKPMTADMDETGETNQVEI